MIVLRNKEFSAVGTILKHILVGGGFGAATMSLAVGTHDGIDADGFKFGAKFGAVAGSIVGLFTGICKAVSDHSQEKNIKRISQDAKDFDKIFKAFEQACECGRRYSLKSKRMPYVIVAPTNDLGLVVERLEDKDWTIIPIGGMSINGSDCFIYWHKTQKVYFMSLENGVQAAFKSPKAVLGFMESTMEHYKKDLKTEDGQEYLEDLIRIFQNAQR